tara:strand:- start:91 stop:465 length:375 start_codon:yes stop_codon:yes gene_type:complete
MIKEVTIKLGGTKQAKRQYESIRAEIETTFTIPHETALDLEKAMEAYKYELRRAKVMLREAMVAATHQIDGEPPKPKVQPKKDKSMLDLAKEEKSKEHLLDEEKLFESLRDVVRQDYLNKQESD